MTAPSQDLIDRLQAAAEDARAAAREAREARKDLRQAIHETKEVKAEIHRFITETLHEDIQRVWEGYMKEINITELGDGLKKSFSQWIELLADATKVLKDLNAKDEELAKALQRRDAGVADWRRPVIHHFE